MNRMLVIHEACTLEGGVTTAAIENNVSRVLVLLVLQ